MKQPDPKGSAAKDLAKKKAADDQQRDRLKKAKMSDQFKGVPPDMLGTGYYNVPPAAPSDRVTSNIPSQGMYAPDNAITQLPGSMRRYRTEPIQNNYKSPGREVRSVLTQNFALPGKPTQRTRPRNG